MIRFLLIAFAWMLVTRASPGASSLSPSPSASPPASSDQESCTHLIYDMSECNAFIDNGSRETKPTPGCCTGFGTVVKTNLNCICDSVMSSTNLGLKLNRTRARALPSICGISTDAFSKCAVTRPRKSSKPSATEAPSETPGPSPSPSPSIHLHNSASSGDSAPPPTTVAPMISMLLFLVVVAR